MFNFGIVLHANSVLDLIDINNYQDSEDRSESLQHFAGVAAIGYA
jgi:hypothetical protein